MVKKKETGKNFSFSPLVFDLGFSAPLVLILCACARVKPSPTQQKSLTNRLKIPKQSRRRNQPRVTFWIQPNFGEWRKLRGRQQPGQKTIELGLSKRIGILWSFLLLPIQRNSDMSYTNSKVYSVGNERNSCYCIGHFQELLARSSDFMS